MKHGWPIRLKTGGHLDSHPAPHARRDDTLFLANQRRAGVAYDAESQPDGSCEADGVTYTTSEHAPGLKLFRCEPYRATVSTRSCADRWLKAVDAYGELGATLDRCKTCSVGAAHAGRGVVHYSAWFGFKICPRCNVGTMRMIGNRRCVSCYNRERELKAGKNARGNKPIELMQRPLRTVELLVDVDGETERVRSRDCSGMAEAIVQTLRTSKGKISFGFAGGATTLGGGRREPGAVERPG